jgi:hypothetical protein
MGKAQKMKQILLVVSYCFGVNHFQKTNSLNVNCVEKFAENKKC